MANDDSTGVDLRSYKLQLVNELLTEIFKIIKQEQKANGSNFAHEVAMTFLASYISTCVFHGLKHSIRSGGFPTPDSYGNTKERVEEAVAVGFTGGFSAYDPDKSPDFLCTVHQIDDGVLKGLVS